MYCGGVEDKNCGCNNSPCTNPHVLFSKNHDFGISTGQGSLIQTNQQYIIQYRNPVRSIVSDYHIFMEANPDKDPKKYWFPFAHAKINYWNKFIDKWLLDNHNKELKTLLVPYEKLILSQESVVSEVIQFITGQKVDNNKLEEALKKIQLKPRDRYTDFQFYDPDFFIKLESMAGERLKRLLIPSYKESI